MSNEEIGLLRGEVSRLTRILERALELNVGGSAFGFVPEPEKAQRPDLLRQTAEVMGGKALLLSVEYDVREMELRQRHLPKDFCDGAAWDMLCFLLISQLRERSVSVTAVISSARVPATTALRYLTLLAEAGLCSRASDPLDSRRTWVALTDNGFAKLARFYEAKRVMRWSRGLPP